MERRRHRNPPSLSCRYPLLSITLLVSACGGLPTTPEQPSLVLAYALSLQGVPYRSGGNSPQMGFDCSGFVHHVYGRHGINLPRSSRDMAALLPSVSVEERRPGDLLFFNTDGYAFSHVGIYLGQNQFIHAPSHRSGRVMISPLRHHYWLDHFVGIRRPGDSPRGRCFFC